MFQQHNTGERVDKVQLRQAYRNQNQLAIPFGRRSSTERKFSNESWLSARKLLGENDLSHQGFQVAYYYVPVADKAERTHKTVKPGRWPKNNLPNVEQSEDQETIRILKF